MSPNPKIKGRLQPKRIKKSILSTLLPPYSQAHPPTAEGVRQVPERQQIASLLDREYISSSLPTV